MKVLFLSLWYPNKYDAMAGLFVRKHAHAAALNADVAVLHVCQTNMVTKFQVESHNEGELNETIVYYPSTPDILTKIVRFFKAYHIGFYQVKHTWGMPDVVHANVLTRTAFMAFFMKRRFHIPYVITEHWSRYLPDNLSYKGFVRKQITQFVVNHAERIMPVSQLLESAMKTNGIRTLKYQVIPNAVDNFFYEQPQPSAPRNKKRLLHVSCFDEPSKNVLGIVEAINSLWQKRQDFEVVLVGTGTGWHQVKERVVELNLWNTPIVMPGEQTPLQVKQWFDRSDAFILFSNYETAAVVLAESVATGTPIISTPVGIAPEIVNRETGKLVPKKDIQALAEAMEHMLNHSQEYNVDTIRNYGKLFTMESVANQLHMVYQKAIKKQ